MLTTQPLRSVSGMLKNMNIRKLLLLQQANEGCVSTVAPVLCYLQPLVAQVTSYMKGNCGPRETFI
jgi:hypothetical protein